MLGAISVVCHLSHPGLAYSFQEDVMMQVTLSNSGPDKLETPYLLSSNEVVLRLKKISDGTVVERNTMRGQPGVPAISDVYPLDAGATVTYNLNAIWVAGFPQPGEHEFQIDIQAPEVKFRSPWEKFSVLEKGVSHSTLLNNTAASANTARSLWIDPNAKEPRILQRLWNIAGHDLAFTSTSLLPLKIVTRGPIVSSQALEGMPYNEGWLGQIEKQTLLLSYIENGKQSIALTEKLDVHGTLISPILAQVKTVQKNGNKVLDSSIPADAAFVVLMSGEKSLLQAYEIHIQLKPGESQPSTKILKGPSYSLEYIPKYLTVTQADTERRWVIWVKLENKEYHLKALEWSSVTGFGKERQLASITAEVFSLTAQSKGDHLRVALAAWTDPKQSASPYAGGVTINYVWTAGKKALMGGKPEIKRYTFPKPPFTASVSLSDSGIPWVLIQDVHGLWLGGPTAPQGPGLWSMDTGKSPSHASLFMTQGETPRVQYYDPDAGWQVDHFWGEE